MNLDQREVCGYPQESVFPIGQRVFINRCLSYFGRIRSKEEKGGWKGILFNQIVFYDVPN